MDSRPIAFAATHPSGGIRELWSNLAVHLESADRATKLLALYPVKDAPNRPAADLSAKDWLVLAERRPGSPQAGLRLLAALRDWLREERPHTVFTAMPAMNVLMPVMSRIFSPNTQVVITHHSPTQTQSRLLDRLDGMTGRLRNVHAVVGVSQAVTASLAHKHPAYRSRSRTIRNGLPPSIETLLDGVAPQLPRVAAKTRRIAATGRLAYQKNYPFLLRALARVPDATLDIVGAGPDEVSLRALAASLGIAGRVRFLGQMSREDTLRHIAACDLFAQVSRFEGHSLGLIEAARLGLPLIVSDVPEQIEAVTLADGRRAGAVVGLDDDAALARAIEETAASPERYVAASALARELAEEAQFEAVRSAYAALAA